jgi:hypothetical protein
MSIAMFFGMASTIMRLQPLPVDFRIEGVPAPPAMAAAPAPRAPMAEPPDGAPTPRVPVRAHPAVATGFGKDVPLEFAVRQVVPPAWHVAYAASVNRQTQVSWQGGRPWNETLNGILRPLGLHMKRSGRTLWIAG